MKRSGFPSFHSDIGFKTASTDLSLLIGNPLQPAFISVKLSGNLQMSLLLEMTLTGQIA